MGIDVSTVDISEKFYGIGDDDERFVIDGNSFNYNRFQIVTCHPVSDKETGWRGILLNIRRPKCTTAGIMAHEAEHVTCWICERFGIKSMTFDDSEPRAYLIGWIVECINNVLKTNKKR